jgi:membrane protease YdiL (CAAX protease family)
LALMLVYLYQGQRGFFYEHLASGLLPGASGAEVEWWGTLYQFASACVLFLLVPLVLLKFLGREKLKDLGLGLGDVKFGLWVVLLGWLVLALPGGLSAGGMEDMRAEYPLAKLSVESGSRFVVYQLAYGLLYYVAWEAFFRGFLQMGLRPHIGDLPAILVQTAASTLLHIGKPMGETWAALLAGFLFGALMLRMRSIWPLVLVHWGLGLLTDVFCARASGIW